MTREVAMGRVTEDKPKLVVESFLFEGVVAGPTGHLTPGKWVVEREYNYGRRNALKAYEALGEIRGAHDRMYGSGAVWVRLMLEMADGRRVSVEPALMLHDGNRMFWRAAAGGGRGYCGYNPGKPMLPADAEDLYAMELVREAA